VRPPADPEHPRWLLAALVVLGLIFPLFGLSLVLVPIFDKLVVRRSSRLSDALNTAPAPH
jgi:uncharacterized iron-regulated membrane protein